MSTLDHLTKGRIGWNIVTGYLNSAATGMGLAEQPGHDQRYEIADEYMEVVYKLWEGSWEDGAVVARPANAASSPTRPKSIASGIDGQYYRWMRSISASRRRSARRCCTRPAPRPAAAPSPQSTRNASSSTARPRRSSAPQVADLRRRAAANGRDPADLAHLHADDGHHRPHRGRGAGKASRNTAATPTPRRRSRCFPAGPASISRNTGRRTSCATSRPRRCARRWNRSPRPIPTGSGPCGELAEHVAIGGRGPLCVGSAEQIADEMIGLGRRDRRRRVQPRLRGDAGNLRGLRRPGRARAAAARRLQAASTSPARCARSCSAPAAPGSPRLIRVRASGPPDRPFAFSGIVKSPMRHLVRHGRTCGRPRGVGRHRPCVCLSDPTGIEQVTGLC